MKSLSLFYLPYFSLLLLAQSSPNCSNSYCSSKGPTIRFPFYLSDSGTNRPWCGYPGFGLSCKSNQTFLRLRNNGQFIVTKIDYSRQRVYLNDPNGCMVNRLMENISFTYPPFVPVYQKMFNFFNCSSYILKFITSYHTSFVPCLNKNNTSYEVVVSPDDYFLRSLCDNYWSVSVPVNDFGFRNSTAWLNRMDDIMLKWHEPRCGTCEAKGGICGFESENSSKITCFGAQINTGLSRTAKYNIGLGIGLTGLIFFFGLLCYSCNKHRAQTSNHNTGRDLENPSITHQSARILTGLDGPTINSYPKTILGDSGHVPELDDNTCSICLGEYLPKETLRSIPECNHYFHANCIDEWLKTNSTCPLCRKTPNGSSTATPASSLPLSPSSFTSSP